MSKEDQFDFEAIDWENDDLDVYLAHSAKHDSQGLYLIHHALRNDAPLAFVQRILAVLPDCSCSKTKIQNCPFTMQLK